MFNSIHLYVICKDTIKTTGITLAKSNDLNEKKHLDSLCIKIKENLFGKQGNEKPKSSDQVYQYQSELSIRKLVLIR